MSARRDGDKAMDLDIREMSIDDYDKVITLWRTAEGVGLSESDTRDNVASYFLRNPGLSFVAKIGDEIVGALLCGHDGRRGYLHHLAVLERYRLRGTGRALVNVCLTKLVDIGIPKCNVFLSADNHEVKAFWDRYGWHPRADLVMMQKVITK